MREISGETADRLLTRRLRRTLRRRRGRSDLDEAKALCRTIGRWLHAFHALVRLGDRIDPTAADMKSRLRERFAAAVQRTQDIGLTLEPELPRIKAYFSHAIEELDSTACVLHHPDYSPYNMILTDEGLYVLDLSEVGSGHPLEEAAFFWAYLEALKFTPWRSIGRVSECQAAFLTTACGRAELPAFWQRWGMFMRLSYLTRSEERVGRITGIRLWRRRMLRKRVRHWLANQSWV